MRKLLQRADHREDVSEHTSVQLVSCGLIRDLDYVTQEGSTSLRMEPLEAALSQTLANRYSEVQAHPLGEEACSVALGVMATRVLLFLNL